MALDNYYIAPAGDISQGLTGLGSILQDTMERKEAKAAEEKKTKRTEDAKAAVLGAMRVGDTDKLSELAVEYPEFREQIESSVEKETGINREARLEFMGKLLTNPEGAAQAYEERLQDLIDRGRDPTHTMQSYQEFLANPDKKLKENADMFAFLYPDENKAYKEATASKAEKGVVVDGKIVSPTTGEVIYEGDEDKGEIRADANGIPRYVNTGAEVFPNVAGAKQREVRADQNGIPRYVDDASPVFPDVVKTPQPPTADQSKAALFAQRAVDSSPVIDKLSAEFSTLGSLAGKAMPNALKGEDRKLFDQASRDFINAVLRRESGAAISPGEFESAQLQYLPQPGDTKAVLDQKKRNRETVAAGLKAEAGAALAALNNQLAQPTEAQEGQTATNPQTGEKIAFRNGQWGPL